MNEVLRQIKRIYLGSKSHDGDDYLRALAKNISFEFGFDFVLIGTPSESQYKFIDTMIAVKQGELIDNFSYDLVGTPCENVLTDLDVCTYQTNVARLFPEDHMLTEMSIEAYSGVPIIDKAGNLFGILAILSHRPFTDRDHVNMVVDYFGSRMALELSLHHYEEELQATKNALAEAQKKLESHKL